MRQNVLLLVVLVTGIAIGVGLSSWRAVPTEDMIARASCAACHDVHGAIEFAEAPAQSQVWVLGDVPDASYVLVSDLFPYADSEPGTRISLDDFLARFGVHDFQRVAIESLDGGIVILDREYVTDESVLVPYVEGLRFKDQNQHESTWLKGVRWLVVQGTETPLRINGTATSMGRLLLGSRTTVIAEGGDAMYKSPMDGKLYRGDYAHLYTGVPLSVLMDGAAYSGLHVVDKAGNTINLSKKESEGAMIATVQGRPTLLLPAGHRGDWVYDVVEIMPVSG